MKLIAVRLPDEVAAAVEREAVKQERSKSAVVVRALRKALMSQTFEQAAESHNAVVLDYAQKIAEEKPKRAVGMCVHGRETKFCVYCQKTAKGK